MSHGLNKTEFVSGWVQSPKGRGTWEILYSNMFTLGLCVFTAIHLNVGPSGRTEFQYWLHKCKWVLITVFFPELTLYMAGKQWFTANRLRKKLNKHHQVHFMPTNSSERNLESNPSQDRPDPSIEAVSSTNTPYNKTSHCSMVYAHYATMGGFVVDVSHLHDSLSQLTLSCKGVAFLAKHGHFLHLPESVIHDKSKADLLAKALVCFQVSWQLVDTIARSTAALPLTLLEVHVFVHVACALAMYGLWISKPLDVREPIAVDPSEFQDLLALMLLRNYGFGRTAVYTADGGGSSSSIRATAYSHHNGSEASYLQMYPTRTNAKPEKVSGPEQVSFGILPEIITHYEVDRFEFSLSPLKSKSVCILKSGQSLACGIGPALTVCPLKSPSSPSEKNEGRLAMDLSERDIKRWNLASIALERIGEPLHHHPKDSVNYLTPYIPNIFMNPKGLRAGLYGYFCGWASGGLVAALCVCSFYGAVHMSAWNFDFPTGVERLLWRIACIDTIVGTISLLTLFSAVVYMHEHKQFGRLIRAFGTPEDPVFMSYLFRLVMLLGLLNVPFFFASRVYIIAESFISLRHVPTSVYHTVEWTEYIPHL